MTWLGRAAGGELASAVQQPITAPLLCTAPLQSEGEVEGEEGASEEEGSVEVPDVVALAAKEQAEFDW